MTWSDICRILQCYQ